MLAPWMRDTELETMDIVIGFLAKLGQMLWPWSSELATAMVACLVLVFAADLNQFIRRAVGARSFFTRTCIFVLVNACLYGLLIVSLSPWVARQLRHMPPHWLLLLVVGTFLFIGAWAQRNRQI
jgi:drug/metabolite transporter (DMT)-like permease